MLKIVGLKENLIENLVSMVLSSPKSDLSDMMVVFPSKRMGVFFKDYLCRKMEKNFFPPRIFTIDNFIDYLFNLNYPGYKKIQDIDAILQLFKILKNIEYENLYIGDIKDKHFLDFFPWGLKIFDVIEKIIIESDDLQNINKEIYGEFIKLGDYHKTYKDFIALLPTLISEYLKSLKRKQYATRGYIYQLVAGLSRDESLKIPAINKYFFTGFNALNYSEGKILKYFFQKEDSILLIKSNLSVLNDPASPFSLQKHTLDYLNLNTGKIKEEKSIVPDQWNWQFNNISLNPSGNIEVQMVQVFEKIMEIVKKTNFNQLARVGVVLPDSASLIPFVQGVVSRFDQKKDSVPFNITMGYPFKRTPLYQFIDSILKVGVTRKEGKISAGDYLSLIKHPYIKLSGQSKNLELIRQGIHFIEDIINRNNLIYFDIKTIHKELRSFLSKIKIDNLDQVMEELSYVNSLLLIEYFPHLNDLIDFIKNAIQNINRLHGKKTYLFLKEYIYTAVEALNDLKESLKNDSEGFKEVSLKKSAEFIRFYLTKCKINFEGSPLKGIQVMGMLEFRGLTFDEILFVDTLEGILPNIQKYDPLLPNDIKKAFNMRTYLDWEKLYAINFFSLIFSAQGTNIFWPEKKEDTEKAQRSRFVERIIYELEKSQKPLELDLRYINLEIKKEKYQRKEKELKIREKIDQMTFSPSSIELYVKCPLRFYFDKILNLKERDQVLEDPDAGTFGTIIHEVLKNFYERKPLTPLPVRADIKEILSMLVKKEFERNNYYSDSGIIKIRSWLMVEKLLDFIVSDLQEINDKDITIEALEEEIEGELTFPNLDKSVMVRGIIDRREKEGRIHRILDYKSGGSSFYKRPVLDQIGFAGLIQLNNEDYLHKLMNFAKNYSSMQLFLYILLLEQKMDINSWDIDASFIFLRKSAQWKFNIFDKKNRNQMNRDEKKQYIEGFKADISYVFEDIYLRDYFIANPLDEKYCSYCPFLTICKRGG